MLDKQRERNLENNLIRRARESHMAVIPFCAGVVQAKFCDLYGRVFPDDERSLRDNAVIAADAVRALSVRLCADDLSPEVNELLDAAIKGVSAVEYQASRLVRDADVETSRD